MGPIANSMRDLDLFMTAVTDGKPWEEETCLVPLPWKELTPSRDFTVGVLWDDGIVHPHPPIQRAMKIAVAKMKAAGINTVDWEPYKHAHGMRIINDLFYPDGAAVQIAALESSGEPWLPLTKEAFTQARKMTIPETWTVNLEREAYRSEHRMLMKKHNVDFILCPTYVGVAAEPHQARYFAYTAIWNILDMPGVVFPTGLKLDQEQDVVESGYQPRSPQDEAEYKAYSPEKFVDAPIALQLVCLPPGFHRASTYTASLHSRLATGFAMNKLSLQLRPWNILSDYEYQRTSRRRDLGEVTHWADLCSSNCWTRKSKLLTSALDPPYIWPCLPVMRPYDFSPIAAPPLR